jgi:hypothetical protein
MNSLVILSERKAVARANALRQSLELESARARTVTADQHLLYASVAEFVLHRGRAFETGRLGDAERHGAQRIARWCRAEHNGFRFGQPFWNTRRALEFDVLDQFHYVEGFVLDGSETVPRPHAWLSAIANDVVVDFTGPRARKRRARKYPPMVLGDFSERSYFGVALPRALVHGQGHNRHHSDTRASCGNQDLLETGLRSPCCSDRRGLVRRSRWRQPGSARRGLPRTSLRCGAR